MALQRFYVSQFVASVLTYLIPLHISEDHRTLAFVTNGHHRTSAQTITLQRDHRTSASPSHLRVLHIYSPFFEMTGKPQKSTHHF